MAIKNYYKILSITKEASKKEITKAFRKLAKKYHPDLNPDPNAAKQFREAYEAYELLIDDEKRKQYDLFLGYENKDQFDPNNKYTSTNNENGPRDDSYQSYTKWTTQAKSNAEKYSHQKYYDFVKQAFKGTISTFFYIIIGIIEAVLSVVPQTLIAIIEFLLLFFLVAYLPLSYIETSQTLGAISLSVSVVFGIIYYFFFKKNGLLISYLIFNKQRKKLYVRIFLIYLSFSLICISINYSSIFISKRKEIITHNEIVKGLVGDLNYLSQDFPYFNSQNLNTLIKDGFDINQLTEKWINTGIVVVDMEKKSFDKIHFLIPDSIRAKYIEDINTIIQVSRGEELVGHYTYGAPAYQRFCKLKIIDPVFDIILFDKIVYGPMPIKSRQKRESPGIGYDPSNNAMSFIIDHLKRE